MDKPTKKKSVRRQVVKIPQSLRKGSGAESNAHRPDTDRGSIAHMANFLINEQMRRLDMELSRNKSNKFEEIADGLPEVVITKEHNTPLNPEPEPEQAPSPRFGAASLFSKRKNLK